MWASQREQNCLKSGVKKEGVDVKSAPSMGVGMDEKLLFHDGITLGLIVNLTVDVGNPPELVIDNGIGKSYAVGACGFDSLVDCFFSIGGAGRETNDHVFLIDTFHSGGSNLVGGFCDVNIFGAHESEITDTRAA